MRWKVFAAVVGAALVVAGCSSPESRIRASCMREGGFASKGAANPNADRQCTCFAKQLKTNLAPDQLEEVAKMMDLPKDKRDAAMKDRISVATSAAIVGAAKTCALQ